MKEVKTNSTISYIDMRIAICGNVDSGKSTLVGVLTKGQLDNGRGSVRSKVFKHKHEQDTLSSVLGELHLLKIRLANFNCDN